MALGWAIFWGLIVLLAWVAGWNLLEGSIAHFVPDYATRMVIYGILFVIVVVVAICVRLLVPEASDGASDEERAMDM